MSESQKFWKNVWPPRQVKFLAPLELYKCKMIGLLSICDHIWSLTGRPPCSEVIARYFNRLLWDTRSISYLMLKSIISCIKGLSTLTVAEKNSLTPLLLPETGEKISWSPLGNTQMVESIVAKALNVRDMFINKIPITHSYFELDTSDFAVLPSHIFCNQNIFSISLG